MSNFIFKIFFYRTKTQATSWSTDQAAMMKVTLPLATAPTDEVATSKRHQFFICIFCRSNFIKSDFIFVHTEEFFAVKLSLRTQLKSRHGFIGYDLPFIWGFHWWQISQS